MSRLTANQIRLAHVDYFNMSLTLLCLRRTIAIPSLRSLRPSDSERRNLFHTKGSFNARALRELSCESVSDSKTEELSPQSCLPCQREVGSTNFSEGYPVGFAPVIILRLKKIFTKMPRRALRGISMLFVKGGQRGQNPFKIQNISIFAKKRLYISPSM